ncbi:tRNA (adenosine(37)-N6)-dimethylallyltransferase MiaA [Patescibacteria group bacterium]|nr:tRNA (adenosine(37)-N6)-dimethylallyltransferase MiaA [Patescibacteria group bacterium]
MKTKPKVIVIVGPTSSGKTELSLKLAKKFNGVIISADSRQIYKEMDIATAKTTRDQQQGIPHYMIDIIQPNEEFSLMFYQNTVYNLLNKITKSNLRNKQATIPFIVGGTGLYVQAIVEGYKIPHAEPNQQLREKLNNLSLEKLIIKLKKFDPKTTVDLKNKRRVIRAIEILSTLGSTSKIKRQAPAFDFLQIGIKLPRETLYQRIEKKVEEMYKHGLVKETKKLLSAGYDFSEPAFSALGYKHIRDYIKNKITLKAALELMKKDTKHFAKRQLTWFKKNKKIHWIESYPEAESLIQNFLK